MRAGLDRYLRSKNYPASLLKDEKFNESNVILEGKARALRDIGIGYRPNRSRPLTQQEEETLWNCGQLGISTPMAIINTLWFLLTQHFGLRGRQEHHTMNIEDFTIMLDDNGHQYVTFSEKRTKTGNAGLNPENRKHSLKMFATGTARCPVKILNVCKSKRPSHLREGRPFYLQPLVRLQCDIWFSVTRMGENTIGELMKEMKNNSPLRLICPDKKLTNHSARKTLVKKFQKNGVQSTEIISITGHSTTKGLQPYDEGDETQQRILSNIIDGSSPLKPCNRLLESNTAAVSHVRPITPSTLPSVPSTVVSKSAVVPVSTQGKIIKLH